MPYDPIHTKSKLYDYFLPGIILLSGLVIGAFIVSNNNSQKKIDLPSTMISTGTTKDARAKIEVHPDDISVGNPGSKIIIVEFLDFKCGYCLLFTKETLPQIIEQYIKAGKAKMIFKILAMDDESKIAAKAAICSAEQNKFLDFHYDLYNLAGKNTPFSTDSIIKTAQSSKLNIFKFNDCLGSEKTTAKIEQNSREASLSGMTGTPTVFINGIKISGAQDFNIYKSVIESEIIKSAI